jgi:hypothetical protein
MSKKQDRRQQREAIWNGLQKHYADELKEIHAQQYRDVQAFGRVMPHTDAKLDALLEKIVQDNKREGRT